MNELMKIQREHGNGLPGCSKQEEKERSEGKKGEKEERERKKGRKKRKRKKGEKKKSYQLCRHRKQLAVHQPWSPAVHLEHLFSF